MSSEGARETKYSNAIAIGFMLFLVATAVTMAQYKIPTIMTDIMAMFSIDAGTASWLMSIFTFVGIIVALPTGFLVKRFGPKTVILVAVVLNVAAGVIGAFVTNVWPLLATRALEGVALVFVVASAPLVIQATVDPRKNGTAMGVYQAMAVASVEPQRRGVATSTYFIAFDIGIAIGSLFGGMVAGVLGYTAMYVIVAAFPLVAGILSAVVIKSQH